MARYGTGAAQNDQYMPEYWPANRLIGKLEKALVEAKNIIGQLESAQIKSLEAGKITGQLTNEQLAEIEAAKISGQLTSAQIKELAAAKITGELTSAQIKELAANKLIGKLTNSQIESLEAAKITGSITETQIGNESISTVKLKAANVTTAKLAAEAITAEKIAALTITAGKLAAESVEASKIAALAVTAGKIAAEAVTTEKLAALSITAGKIGAEAITAEKISAGAISTAKLAAGAVTAEKMTVATLAAITANLGTVTAGKISGVEIETLKKFILQEAETAEAGEANRVVWKNSVSGKFLETITGYQNLEEHGLVLTARNGTETKNARLELITEKEKSRVDISAGSAKTLIDSEGKSNFIQAPFLAKNFLSIATFTITFGGEASKVSPETTVAHGLGAIPTVMAFTVWATGASVTATVVRPIEGKATIEKVGVKCYSAENVAAGTVVKVTAIFMA